MPQACEGTGDKARGVAAHAGQPEGWNQVWTLLKCTVGRFVSESPPGRIVMKDKLNNICQMSQHRLAQISTYYIFLLSDSQSAPHP
jgi:hypothetical protein